MKDPNYRPSRRYLENKDIRHGDNYARKYDRICYYYWKPLEEQLSEAVNVEMQKWYQQPVKCCCDGDGKLIPCRNEETGCVELKPTIRKLLKRPDHEYDRRKRCYWHVRVPKLTRNNHEWENFYATFPSIAEEVITGKERYANGARLKWIPLFDRILDRVWQKDRDGKLTPKKIQEAIDKINAENDQMTD